MEPVLRERLGLSESEIERFCTKWQVVSLYLFGSILSERFTDQSDVDVLVSFTPEAPWTMLDLVRMRDELQGLLGRKVDLIERVALEHSRNPIRREAILRSARRVYAA